MPTFTEDEKAYSRDSAMIRVYFADSGGVTPGAMRIAFMGTEIDQVVGEDGFDATLKSILEGLVTPP